MSNVTAFDDGASSAQAAGGQAADRENLTWQGFGDACRQIAEQIADSGWIPDLIVAIARGGMLPAGAISYALGVKANGAINVEFYTGVGKTMTEPEILEPYMDISSLEGKRVLIVDDVADSGKTLKLIMDLISEKGLSMGGDSAKVDARSATIYLKPTSIIKPDYVFKQTDKYRQNRPFPIKISWGFIGKGRNVSICAATTGISQH